MQSMNEESLVAFVFSHYHDALKSSDRAMHFLEAIGFEGLEQIDQLYLGFSDRTLGQELSPDTTPAGAAVRGMLRRLGLLKASGHEYLRGCVTFPLRNSTGSVIGAYAFQLREHEKHHQLVPVSWVRYRRPE